MAGMAPVVQGQQQNPTLPNPNPNQPNPNQNPYQAQPQGQGQGAGLTQPGYLDMSGFSPNATIQQILAGFAPQANQATGNLNQTLADFGINGGQAVNAMSQLQSQLSGAIAPTLANAIMGSQQNQLQGGMFNEGAYNNAQQNQLGDLLNLWGNQFGAFNNINNQGQGAGNQNANQYGSTITQTPSIWSSIMQGLGTAGQAAGAASGFSGPGGGNAPGGPYGPVND